jgi:uncharacterized membrane protein
MMFGYGGHWDFWQVAVMGFAMIAFWALLIWAFSAFLRNDNRGANHHHHRHHDDDAQRILDQRLATGEIDADEYRRLAGVLGSDRSTAVNAGTRL